LRRGTGKETSRGRGSKVMRGEGGARGYPVGEGERLCVFLLRGDCRDCPCLSCNNHPQFHLALECALRERERDRKNMAEAARRKT